MKALFVSLLGLLAVSSGFCSPTNGSPLLSRLQTNHSAVSGELKCPSGWTFAEGAQRCYKANNALITWEQAQAHCETFNATLATIPDRQTDEALRNFTYANVNEDVYHIGIRYVQKPWLEWTLMNGTKVKYTHWYTAPNPPNPVFGLCAEASVERDGGRWYPVPCWDDKRPSVCELPASNVGETLPETVPNSECKDAVSQWKCTSLKSIQACNAAQYIKYMQKNCAKTCGVCP